MKGISPMIAVILLIAFTVAIGAIVSVWITGFTRGLTTTTGTTAEKQAKCAGVYIGIEVKENTSATTNTTVTLTNNGPQPITNVRVLADGTNVYNTSLQVGDVIIFYYNQSTFTTLPTAIRATGFCLDEIYVEGKCSKGQACWT
jgi:flagellin-like protein